MSINKKLILLLSIVGICTVACTKENVDRREEGQVTIIPLWEEYNGTYHPMKYYFYNVDKTSIFPVVREDITTEGITQTLPVGTYRLVGYNTDASEDLSFDASRNFTVVANFTSYPYSTVPLDLCIVSADNIVVDDRAQITKEIAPIEVKTKTLRLRFQFNGINVVTLRGALDGAFASINLLNGKAIKDAGNVFFQANPSEVVRFRISDLYYSLNGGNESSVDPPLYESMLSLTLEVKENDGTTRTKTGELSLERIIGEIISFYNDIPDDILLYVNVENFNPPLNPERVVIRIDEFEEVLK
ncbi:hypothetical protein EZS27_026808 [termite gut metagenome]|uniref:DUF5119 domain-containing protein n=1 Tax=termite gut metagenome TaxID=433724 RepID=A0A5J4QT61_9ZZZZ